MKINAADNLIRLRKAAGLTQEQLAEKLYVTRQAVSKWERGESMPDIETVAALAELYSVTTDEIIRGTVAPETKIVLAEIADSAALKSAQRKKQVRQMVFFALLICSALCLIIGVLFTSLIDIVPNIWLIWLALPVLAPLIFGIRFYAVFGKAFIMYFVNVPMLCMLAFELQVLYSVNGYGAWLVFLFIPLYYAAAAGVTYTNCKKTARKADGSNDSDGSDGSNV